MTQEAMDRSMTTTAPVRLMGIVTNASGDTERIPPGKRWGFIRTTDGKNWFFVNKHVSGEWPQERDYVSFLPKIINVPGKSDQAVDVFVVNRQ